MNKTLFAAAALALFGAVQPASAAMCGGTQHTQAAGNTVSTGMMCGATQAADDPMAEKPAQPKTQQSGMCPCCRNMAMMRGGSSSDGMQHNMPGMDMPKQ
jgi:hypothetical protein